MVGELIEQRRKSLGLSQTELGRRTGTSQRQVSRLENGEDRTLPRRDTLDKFGAVLGISLAEFYQAAGVMEGLPEGQIARSPEPISPVEQLRSLVRQMPITVPVYDQPVSAGRGTPSIQQYLYFSPDSGIPPNWYGLPVIGSCMVPHLFEGDVVVVDPEGYAEPGDMVVAEIDHEQALVKWFTKRRGQLFIEPERGDALPYDENHMRIIGVVMKMWRDVRKKPRKDIMQAAQE